MVFTGAIVATFLLALPQHDAVRFTPASTHVIVGVDGMTREDGSGGNMTLSGPRAPEPCEGKCAEAIRAIEAAIASKDCWNLIGTTTEYYNPGNARKKYAKLSLHLHPDKGGQTAAFQRLGSVYDCLKGSSPTELPCPCFDPQPDPKSMTLADAEAAMKNKGGQPPKQAMAPSMPPAGAAEPAAASPEMPAPPRKAAASSRPPPPPPPPPPRQPPQQGELVVVPPEALQPASAAPAATPCTKPWFGVGSRVILLGMTNTAYNGLLAEFKTIRGDCRLIVQVEGQSDLKAIKAKNARAYKPKDVVFIGLEGGASDKNGMYAKCLNAVAGNTWEAKPFGGEGFYVTPAQTRPPCHKEPEKPTEFQARCNKMAKSWECCYLAVDPADESLLMPEKHDPQIKVGNHIGYIPPFHDDTVLTTVAGVTKNGYCMGEPTKLGEGILGEDEKPLASLLPILQLGIGVLGYPVVGYVVGQYRNKQSAEWGDRLNGYKLENGDRVPLDAVEPDGADVDALVAAVSPQGKALDFHAALVPQ